MTARDELPTGIQYEFCRFISIRSSYETMEYLKVKVTEVDANSFNTNNKQVPGKTDPEHAAMIANSPILNMVYHQK
ncbi:hypothetical protein L249_3771 [Ophiocordyceps polyrhachis-furcata BCC 54312]|nr:hypothetical protein L249_3771 [Ophiocordyceps polyrhachis-furcata BCC 54312]